MMPPTDDLIKKQLLGSPVTASYYSVLMGTVVLSAPSDSGPLGVGTVPQRYSDDGVELILKVPCHYFLRNWMIY